MSHSMRFTFVIRLFSILFRFREWSRESDRFSVSTANKGLINHSNFARQKRIYRMKGGRECGHKWYESFRNSYRLSWTIKRMKSINWKLRRIVFFSLYFFGWQMKEQFHLYDEQKENLNRIHRLKALSANIKFRFYKMHYLLVNQWQR